MTDSERDRLSNLAAKLTDRELCRRAGVGRDDLDAALVRREVPATAADRLRRLVAL